MFKVGDRVRIVNIDGINQNGFKKYKNGDIIEIQDIDKYGTLNWEASYIDRYAPIGSNEFDCIELVTEEEPKKSAVTISITLLSQVLTLTKADYEELKRILSE